MENYYRSSLQQRQDNQFQTPRREAPSNVLPSRERYAGLQQPNQVASTPPQVYALAPGIPISVMDTSMLHYLSYATPQPRNQLLPEIYSPPSAVLQTTSSTASIGGPGPPIMTGDRIKGPEGANIFIFHLPNDLTNWYFLYVQELL